MKIGLLSDTHSIIDKRILKFFENCDEIWHAGDIGTIKTLESLEKFKKIRAVYGNIDNHQIRKEVNEFLLLKYEKLVILIIHIAGKPPKYNKITYNLIKKHKPNILICELVGDYFIKEGIIPYINHIKSNLLSSNCNLLFLIKFL